MASYGYGTGTGVRKAGSKWGGQKLTAAEKREIRDRKIDNVRRDARRIFAAGGSTAWPFGYFASRDFDAMRAAWDDEVQRLERERAG